MEQLTKKILMGLGLVTFIFFALNRVFFFSPGFLEKISTMATYPIVKGSVFIRDRIKKSCERKESYAELEKKYVNIKQAYLNALAETMQLKATINYDNLSRELREFQQRYNLSNMILAKILVKNITDDEHYFLVNKGLKDGIKKDMTAIYKFQLIGKVTEVQNDYCKVLLITDQMCKVAAYANQTASQGIVRGQNNINRCSMNYVSHLFKIVDNDLVLSSGKGLVFPEGFCLGQIVYHEIKDKSLYHDIELEPLINIQALEYCLLTNHEGLQGVSEKSITQETHQVPIVRLPQSKAPEQQPPLVIQAPQPKAPQQPKPLIQPPQPPQEKQPEVIQDQPQETQEPPQPIVEADDKTNSEPNNEIP